MAEIRFTRGGIELRLANNTTLGSWELVFAVKSDPAIESRCGSGLPIAGEFASRQPSDEGERIELTGTHTADSGQFLGSSPAANESPEAIDFVMRHAGDANQDGQFDLLDITAVRQAGKYLTGQAASWSQGDWNGDGVFDSLDVVAALQSGRYLAS